MLKVVHSYFLSSEYAVSTACTLYKIENHVTSGKGSSINFVGIREGLPNAYDYVGVGEGTGEARTPK